MLRFVYLANLNVQRELARCSRRDRADCVGRDRCAFDWADRFLTFEGSDPIDFRTAPASLTHLTTANPDPLYLLSREGWKSVRPF